ncbi:AEC family transporter [Geomicrobium sediminis]|uniref:Permease n=1 Tax=Geomicrobium sediminis TaxID=1347788 RepID=A0ABS2PHR0_9BACL|nr:AEC family transporter [Geomicrobium sediminis]MBM7634817.1 putative permease [Geomicrobium sediminis]
MTIFLEVVLPVLLVFSLGFVLERKSKLDIKPISTLAIYIMTPCLVFQNFYHTSIDVQIFYMLLIALILLLTLVILNKIIAYFMKIPSDRETGFVLSTAFMNAGNYGAPIILFAFGQEGFQFAVMFMVIQSILMNSFGVYFATKMKESMMYAVKMVLTMPAIWALVVAAIAKTIPLELPLALERTTSMVSEATIPTVMLILGMQLAKIPLSGFEWKGITYASIMRLFVSPLIAYGLTLLFPVDPLLANVIIVLAAMPSAANIVMFAVQFEAEPKLVSSITLVTTIISIFSITALLVLL